MSRTLLALTIALLALVVGGRRSEAAPVFFGPSPYVSPADSPFLALPFLSFDLEDFEDGLFNVPGASASSGWAVLPSGGSTDSVDSDDNAIDGSGAGGRSFYSGNNQSSLTITFSPGVLGLLPDFAGIVWTDVGTVSSGADGVTDVTFEAFDALNASLGVVTGLGLGDGLVTGGTDEDRFFGVYAPGGISRIVISVSNSVDWEVDHLQFGVTAVPEPSSALLIGLGAGVVGAVGLARSRRRPGRR